MRQDGRASTYRQEKSPVRREFISHELDEHANRIKELLRADLNLLEQENAILKAKCKKVTELEDKVEMIMKQNSQLLSENDRLSKLLHQKKSEIQVMRDKYESQLSQKMGFAAEFEFEKKKLLNQIDHLQSQISETDHLKNLQINQARSQFQLQTQALKRQVTSTQEVYEQEVRKLREQLDKRDFELAQLMNRLKRVSSDSEYEIVRLKEEKEKFRSQLLYAEQDRKKELETMRNRMEANYAEELEHNKKSTSSSLLDLESKNQRLREMLENRNQDIEQLTAKSAKQKAHSEEVIALLKKENESTRAKMLEFERFGENQKDTLKFKLSQLHEAQIEQMRINNQKFIECLQGEIRKTEGGLALKNAEIEQLIKEKTAIKLTFEGQNSRLKDELDAMTAKARTVEAKHSEAIKTLENKVTERDSHIAYLDKMSEDQLKSNEEELNSLRNILESQKAEMNSEKLSMQEKQLYLKQSLIESKQEADDLKQNLRKQRASKSQEIEEMQSEFESNLSELRAKLNMATSKVSVQQKEIKALNDTIALKEKEARNREVRIKSLEEREMKLERETDDLRSKLAKKDQKTNEMLTEQKTRLETSHNFALESLRSDHKEAISLEKRRYSDLNEKLTKKEDELTSLLKSYQKLRAGMETLTEQEANKRDMTLKLPGATADIIATKNLFDVYLKTRVLNVCRDADSKENKSKS